MFMPFYLCLTGLLLPNIVFDLVTVTPLMATDIEFTPQDSHTKTTQLMFDVASSSVDRRTGIKRSLRSYIHSLFIGQGPPLEMLCLSAE